MIRTHLTLDRDFVIGPPDGRRVAARRHSLKRVTLAGAAFVVEHAR